MRIYILSSFLLTFLSFIINFHGGLYISSYIEEGDLYRISDLQGTGNSDYVLLIISSIALLVFSLISFLLNIYSKLFATFFLLLSFFISLFFLYLMETSYFHDIAFSTIFKGKNVIFILWLLLYICLFFRIILDCYLKINKTK